MNKKEMKNKISMALKDPILQQGFECICKNLAELEKENAELRTKTTALENANRAMVKELDDMTSGGVSVLENVVRSKDQLTKAKEKRIEELTEWLKEASDGKLKLQMLRADLVSKIGNQKKLIAELEEKISILLSCKNCPENKGGYICQKEYEGKCLSQKIQYIKELEKESVFQKIP